MVSVVVLSTVDMVRAHPAGYTTFSPCGAHERDNTPSGTHENCHAGSQHGVAGVVVVSSGSRGEKELWRGLTGARNGARNRCRCTYKLPIFRAIEVGLRDNLSDDVL